MENLLQKFREHHPNPPYLSSFFLGYLQAKLYLDSDLIIDILSQVYFSDFTESEIKEMEKLLISLNLKGLNDYIIKHRKVLKSSQIQESSNIIPYKSKNSILVEERVKCLLCEKNLDVDEIVYLQCLHAYHRDCILRNFKKDIIEIQIFPVCPVCGEECDKKTLEGLDYQFSLDCYEIEKKKITVPPNFHLYWCFKCADHLLKEYKEDWICTECGILLDFVRSS